MRLDTIPQRLQHIDQWCLWRYQVRSGKRTKVPYQPSGKPASTTNRDTWASFADVWEAFTNPTAAVPYDGIGFVFSKDDNFLGVDVDHCRDDDGEPAPWVLAIVAQLNTYAELSPSGEGLHALIETDEELDHGNRFGTLGVEIYQTGRYFTITGDRLPTANADVCHRNQEFRDVYTSLYQRHTCIQEIAKRIKNGDDELDKLWNGDASSYNNDNSRRDMALASRLVMLTKGDTALADTLFRHSGCMRPKWDELRGSETYGAQTIRKASLDNTAQAGQTTITAGPFPLTDAGNVQRLVTVCQDYLRYCPEFGWMRYTGSRWDRDDTAPYTACRAVVNAIEAEAVATTDKLAKKQTNAWAVASQGHSHIKAMVELARREPSLRLTAGDFDTNPWLLNCTNGTVDLRTGDLRDHSRADYLTHQCLAAYNPYAKCPNWLAFLDKIFAGNQETISFIQQAVGYSLTGLVTERAFFILYGRGANGKTTLIEGLTQVLGDYAAKSRVETFMQKRGGGGIPNDVAALVGRRFIVTSESEQGMQLSEGLIKELTGGDKIQARFLRQEFFEFAPACKLWVSTNHKPDIRGQDDGLWSRVKLIPFDVQIPEGEQVPRDTMLAMFAAEATGILSWAVQGCLAWQTAGKHLQAPLAVTAATEEYRAEQDLLGPFFDSYCEFGPNYSVDTASLYMVYQNWAGESGLKAWSLTAFGKELTARGYGKKRSNGEATKRTGLRLSHAAGIRSVA